MIYFITDGEYTKIGVADNPEKRLMELQTGNGRRLKLLLSVDGSYEEEGRLHSVLGKHRQVGEWFEIPIINSEELVAFLLNQYPVVNIEKNKNSSFNYKSRQRTKNRVLECLNNVYESGDFVSSRIISEMTGLHMNTVSYHLEPFRGDIDKHNIRLFNTDNFNTYRKILSVHKINDAIDVLNNLGERISRRKVADKADLHFNTVGKLWEDPKVQEQLEKYNKISIKS